MDPNPNNSKRNPYTYTESDPNTGKRVQLSNTNNERELEPFDFDSSSSVHPAQHSDSHNSYRRSKNDAKRAAKSFVYSACRGGADLRNHAMASSVKNRTNIPTKQPANPIIGDPKWYRTLSRNSAFSKGQFIASMEDGVIKGEYEETYQVYSNTSNYRIVDMAVCKCSCPNWRRVCSHLIAVALRHQGCNYVGRLAILSCVERFVNYLVNKTEADAKNIPDVIEKISKHIKMTTFTEDYAAAYHVVVEIVAGILYRLYQQDKGSLPSICAMPTGNDTSAVTAKYSESPEDVPSNSQSYADLEEHLPTAQLGDYTTQAPATSEPTVAVFIDVVHLKPRLKALIRNAKRLLSQTQASEEYIFDAVHSMLIQYIKLQYHVEGSSKTREAYFKSLIAEKETDDEEKEDDSVTEDVNEGFDLYMIDIFSLCCDVFGKHPSTLDKSVTNSMDTDSLYVNIRAIDEISNAPELVNLVEYLQWNYNFGHLGCLKHFILQNNAFLMQQHSFLYLNPDYIVKIPSPCSFNGDLDIIQHMVNSVNRLNSTSFVALTLTLLAKKQLLAHVPDLSAVIAALDAKIESLNVSEFGVFVIESLELVPYPLLIPLAIIVYSKAKLLTEDYFDIVFSHKLSISALNKVLMIGKAFNLPFMMARSKDNLNIHRQDSLHSSSQRTFKPGVMEIDSWTQSDQAEVIPKVPAMDKPEVRGTTANGKHLIEEIRMYEFGVGLLDSRNDETAEQSTLRTQIAAVLTKQKQRIVRSIKRLSEDLYNRKIHLQLELIQNADDNDYTNCDAHIDFYLDESGIVVTNNENGFQEKDVRSICDVGASSKINETTATDKIGRFGIGFKSVFVLTNEPYIFSNGYNFKFSSDPNLLGNIEYILPHWVEIGEAANSVDYIKQYISKSTIGDFEFFSQSVVANTLVYLPLKSEYRINDEFKSYYRQFTSLKVETLLFLRKIQRVGFYNAVEGMHVILVRKCLQRQKLRTHLEAVNDLWAYCASLFTLETRTRMLNASRTHVVKSAYLVVDFTFAITDRLQEFLHLKYPTRKSRIISIGLALDEIEDANFNVYNHLPICDYGLGFMVHADFCLSSSRETILYNDVWNDLLGTKIADAFLLIMELAKSKVIESPGLYKGLVRAMPLAEDGLETFRFVCKRIYAMLLDIEWVLTMDGTFVRPRDALYIPVDATTNTLQMEHFQLFTSIVSPSVLKELCNMFFVHSNIANTLFKVKLSQYGVAEFGLEILYKLVSNAYVLVDFNKNLKQQTEAVCILLENIGPILYLIGVMYEKECVERFRPRLVLHDANGRLFGMDNVYYSTTHSNIGIYDTEMNILAGQILQDRNITGYLHTVTCLLDEFGCCKLTSENYTSVLLMARIRKLVNLFEGSNVVVFPESVQVVQWLAKNMDSFYTPGTNFTESEQMVLFKRIPIKTADNIFVPLGDPRLICCIKDLSHLVDLEDDFVHHVEAIATLLSHLPIGEKTKKHVISEEYIFTCPEAVKLFRIFNKFDLLAVEEIPVVYDNHQLVDSICNDKNNLFDGIDAQIKYEIQHACKQLHLKVPLEIYDVKSAFFGDVVQVLHEILTVDVDLAYRLSMALYQCVYIQVTDELLFISLQDGVKISRTTLYHQLTRLPWLPFGELVEKQTGSGNADVIAVASGTSNVASEGNEKVTESDAAEYVWNFSCLMSFAQRFDSNVMLLKCIDPSITNKALFGSDCPPRRVNYLDLLKMVAKEIPCHNSGCGNYIYVNDSNIIRGFAHNTCSSLFQNKRKLLLVLSEIYFELNEAILSAEDEGTVVSITEAFKTMPLVVAYTLDGVMGCWNSTAANLCLFKTIVSNDSDLVVLETVYDVNSTGFYNLCRLVGIPDYPSPEYCLKKLTAFNYLSPAEEVVGSRTCGVKNAILACQLVLHLHNVMKQQDFMDALYSINCIPVVNNVKYRLAWPSSAIMEANINVQMIQPSQGIVVAKTKESLRLMDMFPDGSIWLAAALEVSKDTSHNFFEADYFKTYYSGADIEIRWHNILDTLGATDFSTYCWPRMLVDVVYSAENAAKIKSYVILPLMPYIHIYVKTNMPQLYSRRSLGLLTSVLRSLMIYQLDEDCQLMYEYFNGRDLVVQGRRLRKRSFVYKHNDHICWFIKASLPCGLALPVGPTDICFFQKLDSAIAQVESLPIDFFSDLAALVVTNFSSNSTDVDVDTFAKYLYAVYEMTKKHPKSVIDSFAHNFCTCHSGARHACLCGGTDGFEMDSNYHGTHLKSGESCRNNQVDVYALAILSTLNEQVDDRQQDCFANRDIVNFANEYKSVAVDYGWENCQPSVKDRDNELSCSSALEGLTSFNDTSKYSCTEIQEIDTSQFVEHKGRIGNLIQEFSRATCPNLKSVTRPIGDFGEEFAYEVLMELYKQEISDNIVAVVWHNKERESGRPYDITIESRLDVENVVYIEVKATSANHKTFFEVTHREWLFAQSLGAKYEILRISGLGSGELAMTRIVNPYLLWKQSKLGFCLSL